MNMCFKTSLQKSITPRNSTAHAARVKQYWHQIGNTVKVIDSCDNTLRTS